MIIYQILVLIFCVLPIIYFTIYFIYKHILICQKDLIKIYGKSWVIITGPSSGIGLSLTEHFAYLGFNICLIGRNLDKIKIKLENKYKNNKFNIINKDFNNSDNDNFYNNIEEWINKNNVSILVNNIGHRAFSGDYINQKREDIYSTIKCGTFPQSILTQIFMKKFDNNINNKMCIINITAQCVNYNIGLGQMYKAPISIPYLANYEASNAFGFYLAESIFNEIKLKRKQNYKYNNLQFLNITPGAVLTNKTYKSLSWIPFSCWDYEFANNILKLINNVEGQQCAFWAHEISNIIMMIAPFLRSYILTKVGKCFVINK
jgi:short-subunit dehydrogenase